MTKEEIIKISVNDSGNLSYDVNPDMPIDRVIGSLRIVSRILEARLIQDTLSDKDTNKTNNNG